jgi:DNA-binding MarR family transcriptional regulator
MTSGDGRESDEARVVRAVLRLARRLRRLAPEQEVTGSGLALLASLHREGPMSAVALARGEGLQPQSLSRLLARLETEALIERPIDPADRRRQLIALTSSGAAALRRAMLRRRAWLADAMARQLDDADRRTLLAASDVMLRLADHAEEDDDDR